MHRKTVSYPPRLAKYKPSGHSVSQEYPEMVVVDRLPMYSILLYIHIHCMHLAPESRVLPEPLC